MEEAIEKGQLSQVPVCLSVKTAWVCIEKYVDLNKNNFKF